MPESCGVKPDYLAHLLPTTLTTKEPIISDARFHFSGHGANFTLETAFLGSLAEASMEEGGQSVIDQRPA